MDPWLSCQGNVIIQESPLTKFEDNFTIENICIYEKLPDSEEYIAILESKLRKIKNDPNILSQLAAKKEAYMRQLLFDTEQIYIQEEDIELDRSLLNSQILRTLAPQKQVINQVEILELVKHDQLQEDETICDVNDIPSVNEQSTDK